MNINMSRCSGGHRRRRTSLPRGCIGLASASALLFAANPAVAFLPSLPVAYGRDRRSSITGNSGVQPGEALAAVEQLRSQGVEAIPNKKDFKPVVRRDAREWFDSIKEQAPPRPDSLLELSKAGKAQLAEVVMPTRKQEPFRFTDLESLYRTDFVVGKSEANVGAEEEVEKYMIEECARQRMVFVNGVFSTELSDLSGLAGVSGLFVGHVGDLDAARMDEAKKILEFLPEVGADHRTQQGSLPFCSLNQACFTDAAVIIVDEGVEVERPIQVMFFSDGVEGPTVSHPRLVVTAGDGSKVRFAQIFSGQGSGYFANGYTRILLGAGAEVEQSYYQELGPDARIIDTTSVAQASNSTYSINQVVSGASDARSNVQIELAGEHAHSNVYTAALTCGNQRHDVHTTLHHRARDTTCEQQHRNIVADRADCVFKGRIAIDQVAQKADAAQLCRTLLLSDRARITAMPSMEIVANDVRCTHGATVCDMEDEELFYLMSRGISKMGARSLVIKGFADEVIMRINDPKLHARVAEKLSMLTPNQDRAVKGEFQSI